MKQIQKIFPLFFCLLALGFTSCSNANTTMVSTVFMHKYGVPLNEMDWHERGGDGQVVMTRKDGCVITQNYEGGVLQGKTTFTFPHSQIVDKEHFYQAGHLTSETLHFTSGVSKEKIDYIHDTETHYVRWFESGNPMNKEVWQNGKLMNGEYYATNNDLEAKVESGYGQKVQRNAFGEFVCKMEISSGELTSSINYYPNGHPKMVTPYKNNKVHGTRKKYLINGAPNVFENFKNGVKSGLTVAYRDGVPYSELPYQNGKKDGVEMIYNPSGQVVSEITWKNDLKHGISKNYIQNICRSEWFYKGKKVSRSDFERYITD